MDFSSHPAIFFMIFGSSRPKSEGGNKKKSAIKVPPTRGQTIRPANPPLLPEIRSDPHPQKPSPSQKKRRHPSTPPPSPPVEDHAPDAASVQEEGPHVGSVQEVHASYKEVQVAASVQEDQDAFSIVQEVQDAVSVQEVHDAVTADVASLQQQGHCFGHQALR